MHEVLMLRNQVQDLNAANQRQKGKPDSIRA